MSGRMRVKMTDRWREHLSSCYSRGWRDCEEGLEASDCPYIGSGLNLQRMRNWMNGFSDAEKRERARAKCQRATNVDVK